MYLLLAVRSASAASGVSSSRQILEAADASLETRVRTLDLTTRARIAAAVLAAADRSQALQAALLEEPRHHLGWHLSSSGAR